MMVRLDELRRKFPPEDGAAYARAYAEAVLAERLGTLVHDIRVEADLEPSALAALMDVDEAEILRAEEGDASLSFLFLDRLARAAGSRVTVTAGGDELVLGAPADPSQADRPAVQPPAGLTEA
jgi:hypothetical protein